MSLNDAERRRAELAAEKKHQAELRRIERANMQRRREHRHVTYIEKRAESDDDRGARFEAEELATYRHIAETPLAFNFQRASS